MKQRKIFTIIVSLFLVVMSLGMTACSFADLSDTIDGVSGTQSKYEFVGELEMTSEYNEYLGYSVEIKGKLKNISSSEFVYVSVTFAVYDSEGNQLDTALDNMNYLQAGSTWSFSATLIGWTDVYPASCKLVDVTIM